MPAPSYQALYDIPGNVAAAAKAILEADEATLIGSDTLAVSGSFIFGPRENAEMPADRITVTATPFAQASDQQVQATGNAEYFFCHYSGQVHVTVQTPRADATAAAAHAARVGRIMFLHQPAAARYTPDNLPYYEPLVIRLAALPRAEADAEEDVDRTTLEFTFELWILPGAFPAVIP